MAFNKARFPSVIECDFGEIHLGIFSPRRELKLVQALLIIGWKHVKDEGTRNTKTTNYVNETNMMPCTGIWYQPLYNYKQTSFKDDILEQICLD